MTCTYNNIKSSQRRNTSSKMMLFSYYQETTIVNKGFELLLSFVIKIETSVGDSVSQALGM
jgi:hypothetical protein